MMSCAPSTGKIEDGRAIHVMPKTEKLVRRQPRDGKGSALGLFGDHAHKARHKAAAGGSLRRQRRLQALHTAAFLIDQDEKIGPPDRLANLADEAPQLLAVRNVAAEKDQTPAGCTSR